MQWDILIRGERPVMIQETGMYVRFVMASGIVLIAGCSLWTGEADRGFQLKNIPQLHSKSLAGSYGDVGPDGSIKPHPIILGTGGRITGVIKAGGPAPIPDLRTGEMVIKGGSGGTKPPFGSAQEDATFSSDGDSGK